MFQKDLQLTSVKATARVSDGLASIRVEQTYKNSSEEPLEAFYQFPVFANAVVTGCRFILPDETVSCTVEEISEAQKTYDSAVDSGKQAVLATKSSDELYGMNVGNVPAGSEIVVELDYATLVKQHTKDSYRLTIPTTIADWRYRSAHDAETPSPTFVTGGSEAPKLSVEVFLESSCTIKHMKCVNDHDCEVSFDGSNGVVRFSQESLAMNKDFVMQYSVCGVSCVVERGIDGGDSAILVNASSLLKPESSARPGTYIFVVDQSGSMGGNGVWRNGQFEGTGSSPIQQARTAAELMVKSLNEQCKFNVYGFGTSFYSVFDEPIVYSEKSYDTAVKHCRGMNANMGGTEMRSVIRDVLQKLPEGDCFVFLLTDCGVYDIDGIKGLVSDHKKAKDDFCLSVLSIGDNIGYDLSEGLARKSGGISKSVRVDEDITKTALELFNETISFSNLEVSVDFGTSRALLGLQLDTLYYDFVPQDSRESCTIMVTRSDGLVDSITVPIKYVTPGPKQQDLHCIVADSAIRRMTAREKIVELAKQYGIVTQYTALVGVSDADLEIVGGDDAPKPRKRVVIPLQSCVSYDTGSLIVSGGLGVAKNVYYGAQASGALIVSGGCSIGGNYTSPMTLCSSGAAFTSLNCSAVPTFGTSTLTASTVSYASAPISKKKMKKREVVSSIPRSMEVATPLAVTTGGTGMSAYSAGDILMASTARPADKVADADLAVLITHQKYSGAFDLSAVESVVEISEDFRSFVTDDALTAQLVATLMVLDLLSRKKATGLFKFAFEKARAFVLANASSGSKLLMLANELVATDPVVA